MRILHIIFSFCTGGCENMLIDILNKQSLHNNCEVGILIINKDYDENLLQRISDRVRVIKVDRNRGSRNVFKVLLFNRFIYQFNPDVLHFHDADAIKMLLPAFVAKKCLTVHDIGLDTSDYRKYDMVYAISKAVAEDVYSRSSVLTSVIYNGVDIQQINKKVNDSKSFRLVQVARLDNLKKGQDVLLNAMKILKDKLPDVDISVDFIGEGKSLNYLKSLSATYKVESFCKFLGNMPRPYIYEHLCDYSMLVHPSNFEGFGLTVAEGIAAKIPVLVSDNDGPMEIIENGNYGFFFEKGNAEDCARQIENVMAMPSALIKERVDRAYKHAQDNFDIEKTVGGYLEEYKKLLDK